MVTEEFPYGGKYSARVHETIVAAIERGNTKSTAFKLAGLNGQTGFDWIAMGKKDPGQFPLYVKLDEDIETALAEHEAERVAAITQAADNGTWQAAAWWLERRRNEEWGKKDSVKVEGDRPPIQLNQIIIGSVEEIERSRTVLRELAAGRPTLAIGSGDAGEPSGE